MTSSETVDKLAEIKKTSYVFLLLKGLQGNYVLDFDVPLKVDPRLNPLSFCWLGILFLLNIDSIRAHFTDSG